MQQAQLIYADSEKDANLFYATGFLAPDPFIYISVNGRKIMIMSDLELDRARSGAKVTQVLSSSEIAGRLRRSGVAHPGAADIIAAYLTHQEIRQVLVPGNFPVELADALREKGFTVSAKRAPFFEQRMLKNGEEIARIVETQRATEEAVGVAVEMLRAAEIREDFLYYEGEPLTSERLRQVLHIELLKRDCVGEHTIVACGRDAVDPHQEGSGPIRAHQPVVMDVFPRSMRSRYYADMTRTVVRGRASDKIKKMYGAVLEGQQIGMRLIRDGADGRSVHQAILDYFISLGFRTGYFDGRYQGFFHGTGHGVGLDIHEPPRVNQDSHILKAGQVVTVEPGLYYLDAGGVRLEDMVVVTEGEPVNLTTFPKFLEI